MLNSPQTQEKSKNKPVLHEIKQDYYSKEPSSETKECWQQVLKLLEKQVSKPSFETWIKPTLLLEISDDTAIIAVKNEFTRNFLLQSYQLEIQKTLKELLAKSLSLRFIINPELQVNNKDSQSVQQISIANLEQKPQKKISKNRINSEQNFENIVECQSNKASISFAKAILEDHSFYKSLYLFSEPGLGKTHILNAVANEAIKLDPDTRIKYCNAEEFTNELIAAIQRNDTQKFRTKYRNLDLLLIDDFHILDNKKVCQEEFTTTYESLINKGARVIISSNKEINGFKNLNKKLKSLVQGALISHITSPSYSTRVKILTQKSQLMNIDLSVSQLDTIARKHNENIRELEGALLKLNALQNFASVNIDDEIINNLFGGLGYVPENKGLSIEKITKATAKYFGIELKKLKSKSRSSEVCKARHIAIYMSYKLLEISYGRIGEYFSGRKHSSIIHSIKVIEDQLNSKLPSAAGISKIIDEIKTYI